MTPLDRHERAVLQFSGGKDSTACLHLLRPHWDKITVLWVNTGDAFPETLAIMERVRNLVPHFHEERSDVIGNIQRNGWPVDVLPISHSVTGRMVVDNAGPLMQPYTACCWGSIWEPLMRASANLRATLVIRGQRTSEAMKSPIRSGAIVNGVEYWFPIENWPEGDVFAYLADKDPCVPDHYAFTGTSLDCMHCTAWLEETDRTIQYLKRSYPDVHSEVVSRLAVVRDAVAVESARLERAING